MDMTSITAALAGIKSATDIAKIIKDSGASLEQAELKLKLAELISALAEAKIEIANIQENLLKKETQIKELNQKLELRGKIKWQEPYYFVESNGQRDGPYCQKCYDSKQQLIRLQSGTKGYWVCFECKSKVTDDDYDNGPTFIGAY